MPSPRLLIPLAALACLGAPAAADAAMPITEVEYRVTVEATATYSHERFRDFGNAHTERGAVSATAKTRAMMTDIVFRNGRLLNVRGVGTATHAVTGGGTTTKTTKDDKGRVITENGLCSAVGMATGGVAELARDADAPGSTETLDVRAASWSGSAFDCTKVDVPSVAFTRGLPFPEDTLDFQIELPAETVGMGKIIHLVSAPAGKRSPQFCPGQDQYTVSCAFNWSAKVTFEKTAEHTYGVEPLPPGVLDGIDESDIPMPPARGPAAPTAPPAQTPRATPPAPVVNRLTPSIARRAAALSRRGLTFTAACPRGCAGTAILLGRSGRRLARLSFRVAAGGPRNVTVKLPRRARAALRRSRGAKVHVTLRPRGGAATTATLAVRR